MTLLDGKAPVGAGEASRLFRRRCDPLLHELGERVRLTLNLRAILHDDEASITRRPIRQTRPVMEAECPILAGLRAPMQDKARIAVSLDAEGDPVLAGSQRIVRPVPLEAFDEAGLRGRDQLTQSLDRTSRPRRHGVQDRLQFGLLCQVFPLRRCPLRNNKRGIGLHAIQGDQGSKAIDQVVFLEQPSGERLI